MDLALFVIELILNIVAILLHTCGAILLFSHQKRNRAANQTIFILQLSISELLLSLFNLVKLPINWLHNDSLEERIKVEDHPVTYYFRAIQLTLILWVYHLSMVYITLDRFLHVYLGFNYKLKITKRKVWHLSLFTWILCSVCSAVLLITNHLHAFDYATPIYNYLIPILQGIFLVSAIVTYAYIVYTFYRQKRRLKYLSLPYMSVAYINIKENRHIMAQSRQSLLSCSELISMFPLHTNSSNDQQPIVNDNSTHLKKSKEMKVYIPVMIITSFTLFIVLPHWLTHFSGIHGNGRVVYYQVLLVLAELNSIVDAVVYIFLQDALRKKVLNTVSMVLKCM